MKYNIAFTIALQFLYKKNHFFIYMLKLLSLNE